MSRKPIVLSENQFNFKQIQGVKSTSIYIPIYLKEIITKKYDLKTLLRPVFTK